jgi:hypothetical protein
MCNGTAGSYSRRPGRPDTRRTSQSLQIRLRTNGRLLMSKLGAAPESKVRRACGVREVDQHGAERNKEDHQNRHVRQCEGTHCWEGEGILRSARHSGHIVRAVLHQTESPNASSVTLPNGTRGCGTRTIHHASGQRQ